MNSRCFFVFLVFQMAAVFAAPPKLSPWIVQKKAQYKQMLLPPSEELFHPEKILAVLEKQKLSHAEIGRIEDLLDARSELYTFWDIWNHSENKEPEFYAGLKRGYDALNRMDLPALRRECGLLRKAAASLPKRPLTTFSPCSWIKSFSQWGFEAEPNPWNIRWKDGFRFRIFTDDSVTVKGAETSFRKHLPVSVKRTWVSSVWRKAPLKVSFSVLSPIIDLEGSDTLELSGFRLPPAKLEFITANGLYSGAPLARGEKISTAVIASALMDFSKNGKTIEFSGSGEQQIDPLYIDRPWMSISFMDGARLLILPGSRPESVSFIKGKLKIKFLEKNYISLVRMPPNLNWGEIPQTAEFFASVAAALPDECFEQNSGDKCIWKYTYRTRKNEWNLKPQKIAPVPPLAQLAELSLPGAKKVRYMSRYGSYHYFEGDQAELTLPEKWREITVLRGINSGINEEKLISDSTRKGAGWIRLVLGSRPSPEAVYAGYEKRLQWGVQNNQKFLIDPHNLKYVVNWGSGFQAEKEKDFLELWDRLSRIGGKYPSAIAGYDLYNELGVSHGGEMHWKRLCEKAAAVIQKNHPGAVICATGMCGANPEGLTNWQPPENAEKVLASFHFYSPHAFTHQLIKSKGHGPVIFYPGYIGHMDWKKGIPVGTPVWYDKWTLAAQLLPAFELFAERGIPLHCGEFSVVGYANQKAFNSAFLWTYDTLELFEHERISWHLWHRGFGIGNKRVVDLLHKYWKK